MSKSFHLGIMALLALLIGNICLAQIEQSATSQSNPTVGKNAIIQADRDFAKMASDIGIAEAFTFFAADSAIILRRGSEPIVGRDAIRALYAEAAGASLLWAPYFADTAGSNDLGYTLGKSQFAYKDSSGVQKISYGYYVTIWKKQPDGSWKYVLDTGVTAPPPAGAEPIQTH